MEKGFINGVIHAVYEDDATYTLDVTIPIHREMKELEEILPNLTQQLSCMDFRITETKGKFARIQLGKSLPSSIPFNETHLSDGLKLIIPSSFGITTIDFEDGASCHLLNGGTTRMGKTQFLLYLTTTLYMQTSGDIQLHISSAKIKDFYPLDGLPGVTLNKTHDEVDLLLDALIQEYKHRDNLINSSTLRKATDSKSVRKHYPSHYHHFKPVFLIIDEYARFSTNKTIQSKVTELIETAGYVNIHVIIASQRPDARTVLNPRIKANLLCRICFTTSDEANSMVILDRKGAESLGRIPGRALLSNSTMETVQIPYVTATEADEYLTPYRKDEQYEHIEIETKTNEQEKQGCSNPPVHQEIQGPVSRPIDYTGIFDECESGECVQSGDEAINNGWNRLADTTNKG